MQMFWHIQRNRPKVGIIMWTLGVAGIVVHAGLKNVAACLAMYLSFKEGMGSE